MAAAAPIRASALESEIEGLCREELCWQDLYDEHFRGIYRLALSLGVGSADVDDIVQRVFMVAHRRLSKGERVHRPGGWLRGITVRVVSEHRRWHRVRRTKEWLLRSTAEASHVSVSPEHHAGSQETQQRVWCILDQMSYKLRETLVLLVLEDSTPAEVAQILNIPVNTVRSRKRLACEEFARRWQAEYGIAECGIGVA